jgi:methylglyoxal synthase
MQTTIAMAGRKKIALVAHDNKKEELFEWAELNCKLLAEHSLYATGTTGQLLRSRLGLNVMRLESGPLGGDQQIGSRISEGQIDCVIFFSDPLEPQPPRFRCESAPPDRCSVEHSGCVQSGFGRFHHFIATHVDSI